MNLNFAVAFLLIKKTWKTWDDRFAGKVGGWVDFRKWVGVSPSNEEWF